MVFVKVLLSFKILFPIFQLERFMWPLLIQVLVPVEKE